MQDSDYSRNDRIKDKKGGEPVSVRPLFVVFRVYFIRSRSFSLQSESLSIATK